MAIKLCDPLFLEKITGAPRNSVHLRKSLWEIEKVATGIIDRNQYVLQL